MLRTSLALVAFSSAAFAQDALPTIGAVLSEIDRREVSISGDYREQGTGRFFMSDDGGWFNVALAVDRDSTLRLMGCASPSMMAPPKCTITGSAEIIVDDGRIGLLIFDLTEIQVND